MVRNDSAPDELITMGFTCAQLIQLVQGQRLLVQERRPAERKPYQQLLDALNKRLEIELALKERTDVLEGD